MILQRYIFRELLTTFAIAFAILVAVCSVGLIFNMFRSAEGITLSLVFGAVPVAFAYMAPWALVVAATLASTMVYGRLAAENEIDAMRTSGIHMGRIVAPALLYAVFIFVLGFLIQHELAPWARYQRRDIIGDTIIELLSNPPAGNTNIKIGGGYRLTYLDAKGGEIFEPTLASFNAEGDLENQLRGATGVIKVLDENTVEILIRQASFTIWEKVDDRLVEKVDGYVGDRAITIKLEDPNARGLSSEEFRGLALVSEWSRTAPRSGEKWSDSSWRNTLYTELHLRFAKSLGPICLILLGIPIGISVKKGTKLSGLGMALPPLLFYFILFFVGQGMAQRRQLPPEIGAYGPNAVVLLAALGMMWRAFRL